jgi:hypothetical protein
MNSEEIARMPWAVYFNNTQPMIDHYLPPPFKADVEHRYSDREWAKAVVKNWKRDHVSLRPVSLQRRRTWVKQVYYAAESNRHES